MQIGIDLGASKIESVVLSDDGKEHLRERENTPQSYNETISLIKKGLLIQAKNIVGTKPLDILVFQRMP